MWHSGFDPGPGEKKKVNNVGQLVKFEQLDNFTVVILFVKLWEARWVYRIYELFLYNFLLKLF